MPNIISIKSVLRESIGFYKNNIKDLSIIVVKCCILTFSIDTAFEFIEKYLENYMYFGKAVVIINMIIICYVINPLYILINHSIVDTQRISLAFFENMFTRTAAKIFLFDTILILPAVLFGIFIWSKFNINSCSTIIIISIVSIFYLISLVRLSVINTHIIANNEFNFKYNWNLTKNNFFKILILLLICLSPMLISYLIILSIYFLEGFLIGFSSVISIDHSKLIKLFKSQYYSNFIDLIFDLTTTYIIAFYIVAFTYAYIHLTKNFLAGSNNLSDDRSPKMILTSDHLN